MPAQTFLQFWAAQRTPLPLVPTPSTVHGGVYFIIGGNHGLGFEAAKKLVSLTASRVIITVRSETNGRAALAAIEAATGISGGVVEAWLLDLADFASVRAFVDRVSKTLDRVDAVVSNASIATDRWTESEGMETTVAVNVVGTFLLALLLFPKLVESGRRWGIVPHLSVMGSGAAFHNVGVLEKIEGDILRAYNTPDKLPMAGRYEESKLLQFYVYRELTALLPYSKTGVVINYINPGLCNTGLARNAALKVRIIVGSMNLLLGRTPEMGSRTLLHGTCAGPESHGKFVSECAVSEYLVPEWATDESGRDIQKKLWKEIAGTLNKIEPKCVERALSARARLSSGETRAS